MLTVAWVWQAINAVATIAVACRENISSEARFIRVAIGLFTGLCAYAVYGVA